MTYKDRFFIVDPDQSSIREGIEKAYTKSYETLKEAFSKYRELKKRYVIISVYRIEDEYEECVNGMNVLLRHRQYTLTEA